MDDKTLFAHYKRTAPGGDLAVLVEHYRRDATHYDDDGTAHAVLVLLLDQVDGAGALRRGANRASFYRALRNIQDQWRQCSNRRAAAARALDQVYSAAVAAPWCAPAPD